MNASPMQNEVVHYSDTRIKEIIINYSDYSSILVSSCKYEATQRNLDINLNFMLDNPFSNQVESYSNEKIIEMLEGTTEYSPKLLDACRLEAKNRNLELKKPKITNSNRKEYLITIQENLQNGLSIEIISKNLQNRGFSEEDSLTLIDNAVNSKPLKRDRPRKESNSGMSVFGTLFIIYVIIKWIYIFFR